MTIPQTWLPLRSIAHLSPAKRRCALFFYSVFFIHPVLNHHFLVRAIKLQSFTFVYIFMDFIIKYKDKIYN